MCCCLLIFSENPQEETFSYRIMSDCQLLHRFEILTPLEVILHVDSDTKEMSAVTFPSIFSSPHCCHCCCRHCCKLFTYSSSSQELLGQLQPNLTQSIHGARGFKGDQMKSHALFLGEIIMR